MPRKSNTKSNTKSAKGSGTIRQRKDGTWEARYTVGRDPGTGKQIQKSVYGKTQKEVRQKLTEKVHDIDRGVYTEPNKTTLTAWLDIWITEYVTNHVKPLTVSSYKAICENYIKPAIGSVKLSELTTPIIQKLYNQLKRGTKDKKPISAKTVKNVHGVLHAALKKAVLLRYIPFNPADACELPRTEKAEIVPLEEKDISAFLSAIEGDPFEILFTVTLFTGMREGEVLGLTWDNVDFENGIISVSTQLQKERKKGGEYYLASPKNSKPRTLKPARTVMQLLRKRKVQQAEDQLRAGEFWDNSWNLVFTNDLGRHLVPVTVYKTYKKYVSEIGRPDARVHDLRHTYAVAALQTGDDVKTVQSNLGHHTAAFTLDVYGHVTEKMKQQSADRMEAFIKGVKSS